MDECNMIENGAVITKKCFWEILEGSRISIV